MMCDRMKITVRHAIDAPMKMKRNARVGRNPTGTWPIQITTVKYENANATDPITAMMFRPVTVFHHGAKSRYSKENSTVTTVVL